MPSAGNPEQGYRGIVERLLSGHDVTWQELDALRAELAAKVFGSQGWSAPPEAVDDARTATVVDLFQGMELLDPDEPAFAWNRAGLLCDLGQYAEGAAGFLEAARRLDAGIEAGTIEPDEEEWSQAARAYACRALLLAGRVTAAAVAWRQLRDDDYREEIDAEIESSLRDPAAARDPIEWIPHPRWQDLRG